MVIDRKVVAAALVGLAIGWWLTGSSQPAPAPANDRPVLRWVAKAARWALWLSLAAESPPEPQPNDLASRHMIGPDGQPVIDHGRGW